ncbi:protein PTHB1 [Pieris brassicae]|uniref:protein PTHB1 n=1 Tax=Pieris brassicae TaxID=7116 RepID=UPI001E662794|nr:protein PTHB1 [Pieris brassicae]
MSIFKSKPFWSNEKLQSETYDEGIQNSCCVKVDKFNSHNDSDCIIACEGRQLKIYKPSKESESDIILESDQKDVILQIETGKFIMDSSDRQILILHPQSYATYFLEKKDGHIDAGVQNYLRRVLNHSFTKKACSVIVGPFGVTKSRDLICIQALDGALSFFDQDTFLFMCLFDDIIIPTPIGYVLSNDVFIICKSTWIMEIYSYQQLRELSELSGRQNKKNIPQWTYSPGEEISALQVIRTSSTFSSIITLGERYLYCFQDNGLMKFMIRFDFMPVCFYAYLIGWYYEPNSRLIIMVVSDDAKLYVYEDTTLLWSCDLLNNTIAISRCFLKNLAGGIVTLSTNGIISVSYLGTEPDLNSTIVPMTAATEPEDILAEIEAVEEALEKIMGNEESLEMPELVKIKIEMGKPIESFIDDFKSTPNCSLIIILTCEPQQIQNIQITYFCKQPFSFSDSCVCLDDINGTEIVETRIFLNDFCVSNNKIKIIFTITDCTGKIHVLVNNVLVPLSLYTRVVDVIENNSFILYLQTNLGCISLENVFEDTINPNSITFSYKNKTVTIKIIADQYTLEGNDCTDIYPILNYFLDKLQEHHTKIGINLKVTLKIDPELYKHMVHRFLKTIEMHAKERIVLKKFEAELNVLQSQFTLIQKKLLIQYGSLPPGDCDALEFLMRDTHSIIVRTTEDVLACKDKVISISCEVSAIGHLLLCVLKHSGIEEGKLQILEETLSLDTFCDNIQDWEESVTQASSYILNTILKKSKDKEKISPVTDQDILSQVNIKRFLKQTKFILENLTDKSENITRIEEVVEVI